MTARLLFVLDLNGTLLHRTTNSRSVELARTHPRYRPADAVVRGNALYLRPGLPAFLARLFTLGSVAVWTSAVLENAVPMVMHACSSALSENCLTDLGGNVKAVAARHAVPFTGEHSLLFLWGQEQCDIFDPSGKKITPEESRRPGSAKPSFRKDLDRIWRAFPAYGPENTLMIDDSPGKIALHEASHVHVQPFEVTDHDVDFTADTALLELANRLGRVVLAFDDCGDVRKALSSVRADDLVSALEDVAL